MEDNRTTAEGTAGKIPEKETGGKAKAPRDTVAPGGTPGGKAPRAMSGATPGTSAEGRGMLKKKYPTSQELRIEKSPLPNIPSKVSLTDIPLPAYMKGAVGSKSRAQGTLASVLQSAREAGIDPRRPAKNEARIVAVKETHRSELDENGLPVIRTYAADMNREIQKKGATLASIVGEERERAAKAVGMRTDAPRLSARKAALAIGIGLFVVVGVGAIVSAIVLNKKEDPAVSEVPLIYVNARATIEVTDAVPLIEALARAREDSAISLGEVAYFIITKDGLPLEAKAVLEALGAPNGLSRNATRVMLGVHAFNRNQPFLIVRTSFYDSSFQAMLAWETSMAETLKDFFGPTGAGAPPPLVFSDAIFKNIDMRQSTSVWPIIYAFPAKDTLIVTTNTNTLNEILTRLATGPR